MKVENMTSRNGNKIPNQFIITNGDTTTFQSYDSIIIKVVAGVTYLDKRYWDYSVTTGKYRNLFLGEKKEKTERKIKEGKYILTDLN